MEINATGILKAVTGALPKLAPPSPPATPPATDSGSLPKAKTPTDSLPPLDAGAGRFGAYPVPAPSDDDSGSSSSEPIDLNQRYGMDDGHGRHHQATTIGEIITAANFQGGGA